MCEILKGRDGSGSGSYCQLLTKSVSERKIQEKQGCKKDIESEEGKWKKRKKLQDGVI